MIEAVFLLERRPVKFACLCVQLSVPRISVSKGRAGEDLSVMGSGEVLPGRVFTKEAHVSALRAVCAVSTEFGAT